jgi:hypothetical protein
MEERKKVADWHKQWNMEALPIPEEATVEVLASSYYGLQTLVTVHDGPAKGMYHRHQSGPGMTLGITDGDELIAVRELREELDCYLLKGIGGFTGGNIEAGTELVEVKENLATTRNEGKNNSLFVTEENYPALFQFSKKLIFRELGEKAEALSYSEFEIVDFPTGYSNIQICSIMGFIRISSEEMKAFKKRLEGSNDIEWLDKREVSNLYAANQFGDENFARLAVRFLHF